MRTKESVFRDCALMILRDECPPAREHYLCMRGDDDTTRDCTQCWENYIWGISFGFIELPHKERGSRA